MQMQLNAEEQSDPPIPIPMRRPRAPLDANGESKFVLPTPPRQSTVKTMFPEMGIYLFFRGLSAKSIIFGGHRAFFRACFRVRPCNPPLISHSKVLFSPFSRNEYFFSVYIIFTVKVIIDTLIITLFDFTFGDKKHINPQRFGKFVCHRKIRLAEICAAHFSAG